MQLNDEGRAKEREMPQDKQNNCFRPQINPSNHFQLDQKAFKMQECFKDNEDVKGYGKVMKMMIKMTMKIRL